MSRQERKGKVSQAGIRNVRCIKSEFLSFFLFFFSES